MLAAAGVGLAALAAFLVVQARVAHPMVPLGLFGSWTVVVTVVIDFAFMVGYYGLPFVVSLYVQQLRGLAMLGVLPVSTPLWVLSALMILVGLGGPLVSPPVTAVLLDSVPGHRAGTASGVFNTSRQLGGALAVAVFGGPLATPAGFQTGVHASLLIAAAVLAVTTAAALTLRTRTLKEGP